MSKLLLVSGLVSLLSLTSCMEAPKKKRINVELPKLPTYELYSKKSGHKCDLISENENKEVFVQMVKKDNKTIVHFYEFASKNIILMTSPTMEGHRLASFEVTQKTDSALLTGESIILHSDPASLGDHTFEVISVTGKIFLYKNMTGAIERKFFGLDENKKTSTSDYQAFVKIENCEAFEARAL